MTPEEIFDLGRRLRSATEIQGILRDGRGFRASGDVPPPTPRPAGNAPFPAALPAPSPAPPPAASVQPSWKGDPAHSATLADLNEQFHECRRCPLAETRTKFVFGVGNPEARVVFVGEAPGRDEDLKGEPFVGRAGQLLDKILEAIGWTRNDVYIANILKCRPPGNRNPEPAEIAACEGILRRQIEIIRPVILCTLGAFAARTLLGTKAGISQLRGQLHDYRGIPVVPTYHPAALLRNPNWKRPTWEDIQMLRKEHDRLIGGTGSAGNPEAR